MTERTLILLRHGQSTWNESNQFTGWVDVPLTPKGEEEAKRGGELLREHDLLPDVLYTSLLTPRDPDREHRPRRGRPRAGSP